MFLVVNVKPLEYVILCYGSYLKQVIFSKIYFLGGGKFDKMMVVFTQVNVSLFFNRTVFNAELATSEVFSNNSLVVSEVLKDTPC
jgi:hypothetical protein